MMSVYVLHDDDALWRYKHMTLVIQSRYLGDARGSLYDVYYTNSFTGKPAHFSVSSRMSWIQYFKSFNRAVPLTVFENSKKKKQMVEELEKLFRTELS